MMFSSKSLAFVAAVVSFFVTAVPVATAATPQDNDNSNHHRQLKSKPETSFCKPGYNLAWVTFDFRKDWTPIQPGEYLTDIGFGFTMSLTPWGPSDNNVTAAAGPRVYDSNGVGGLAADLELQLGNILVIQEEKSTEPNDNLEGGAIVFKFDNPTDIYSLQLIDFEEKNKIFFVSNRKRTRMFPTRVADAEYEDFVVRQYAVDKMKVSLFGSGAIGNIKMCIPKCGV